jgi:LuxR family transcriptional regulator, maltose regulon positive regulatory protein
MSSKAVRHLWRDVRHLQLDDPKMHVDAAEQHLLLEGFEQATDGVGDLFAIRAMILAREDDTLSASAAAEQALRRGAKGALRSLAALVLRYSAWKAGASIDSGGIHTLRALRTVGSPRSTPASEMLADVLGLTFAAAIEFSRLQVTAAEHLARCAVRRAGRLTALSASPSSALARILYEKGELQESEQLLRSRLPEISAVGGVDCIANAYGVLARIATHNGDRSSALAAIEQGLGLAQARLWPRLLAAMLAERVRIADPSEQSGVVEWLAQLRNLSHKYKPPARCAHSEIACHLHKAQLYAYWTFRSGPSPRCALAQLRYEAWLNQDFFSLAWVDLAEAQTLWIEGDRKESVRCLAKSLRTAQTMDLRQSLLDAGPPLTCIIEQFLQEDGIEPALLAFTICVAGNPRHTPAHGRLEVRRGLVGGSSLTPRERDVLRLIGEGQTNKSIAQRQGVAPETVKTHVKNIFVKLGVERRAQAVVKADKLGLLPI